MGFSLREIEELLGFYFARQANCQDVRDRAQQKVDDLHTRIAVLQKMATALELLVAECDKGAGTCPILARLAEEL
ncbi:MAG: MerR family DNA-binding protein [Geopsychrobacter sp.]|nr:MerR family DNA-binding protein [Geopsychrobacter sp.]